MVMAKPFLIFQGNKWFFEKNYPKWGRSRNGQFNTNLFYMKNKENISYNFEIEDDITNDYLKNINKGKINYDSEKDDLVSIFGVVLNDLLIFDEQMEN